MERDRSFLVDEICEKVLALADEVQVEAFLSQCQDRAQQPAATGTCDDHAKAVPQA
jgi:hypothetical protein